MTRRDLLLGGRYRLSGRIASGGMGEVWQGTDELLGRQVAVKLLQHQYSTDATFRTRFRAEAQYTARLTHPGIAQVYDYGEQDDLSFLIMELVAGQPLSEILARHGRLGADVTLDIVAQAARALHTAHLVGVMHRDIKPGNLLVTHDGMVKLTDFGIARAVEAVTLTQTGTVMGTAQYVSPEQAAGRTLTPSTDIYSLGVVAYECLSGGPPFTADAPVTVALKHVRESPPPLPDDVPEPVQELVAVALEKDPAARPRSAAELADRAHTVRETLELHATHAIGPATLPGLVAPASAPGEAGAGESAPAETAATEREHADNGAPTPAEVAAHEDGRTAEAETHSGRRMRRGAALGLVAVLVLASALVVGALWPDGQREDGGHRARLPQVSDSPTTVREAPPPVRVSPSEAHSTRTTEDEPPERRPGGNIGPRSSPPDSPRDNKPEPSATSPSSPTGSPPPSGGQPPSDEQSPTDNADDE